MNLLNSRKEICSELTCGSATATPVLFVTLWLEIGNPDFTAEKKNFQLTGISASLSRLKRM